MERQDVKFINPNMSRIMEHLEKHGFTVKVDAPDTISIEGAEAGDEKVDMTFKDIPHRKSVLVTVNGKKDHPDEMSDDFYHLINHVNEWDNPGRFTIDGVDHALHYTRYYTNYELRPMDLHQLMFEMPLAYMQCEELLDRVAAGESVPDVLNDDSEDEVE